MEALIADFLEAACKAYGDGAVHTLERTISWAASRHAGRLRASGESAASHGLRVARILTDMGMDLDSALAAIVHDIPGLPGQEEEEPVATASENVQAAAGTLGASDLPESTDPAVPNPGRVSTKDSPKQTVAPDPSAAPKIPSRDTRNPLQSDAAPSPQPQQVSGRAKVREARAARDSKQAKIPQEPEALAGLRLVAGPGPAAIVAGMARIAAVRARNKTVHAAETMRKMLFAMTGDLRVIIAKLADKLDSMRTLKYLSEEDQKRIATECLDVFAPLADRLGISWLKDELEDLALKTLNREAYDQIKEIVAVKKREREALLTRVRTDIVDAAAHEDLAVEVQARAKHFYSIYQKMRKKAKGAEELYDLLGIRILCDSDYDCYALLGLVHRLWKPIDGRFKDYIAMPKANGYRSLHTTVMGYGGALLEVQIRTKDMHRLAEFGVASHWLYKGGSGVEAPREADLPILSRIREWKDFAAEGAEYLETIKRELLKDSIFVFTPMGDIIELPAGSTPLDFAFAIHTDVGSHCLGAKADGAIVPLDSELKNTQVVEILTSPVARPNVNWLRIARTSKARSRIRAALVASGQVIAIDKSIIAGRKAGEKLDEHGKPIHEAEDQKGQTPGHGASRADQGQESPQTRSGIPVPLPSSVEYHATRPGEALRNDRAGVAIGSETNTMIRIARCCRPVTGDRIVGYVSRGRGIIVHRADCSSIAAIPDFPERRIDVSWEEDTPFVTARYRVTVRRSTDIFSEMEAAVHKFRGRLREGRLDEQGDGTLAGYFTMEVDSREELKRVARSLRGLPSILTLEEE